MLGKTSILCFFLGEKIFASETPEVTINMNKWTLSSYVSLLSDACRLYELIVKDIGPESKVIDSSHLKYVAQIQRRNATKLVVTVVRYFLLLRMQLPGTAYL